VSKSDPCNKYPITKYLINKIPSINKKSITVLDLGIGEGDFGAIIKKKVKKNIKLTGVEIWKPYKHPQWKFYDTIYFEDIRTFLKNNKKKYDCVLLIDIIEHFNKRDGTRILSEIIKKANVFVVISTPITPYPQRDYNGNPYEKHKYFWSDTSLRGMDFRRIFIKRVYTYSKNPKYAHLGIYVLEKVIK